MTIQTLGLIALLAVLYAGLFLASVWFALSFFVDGGAKDAWRGLLLFLLPVFGIVYLWLKEKYDARSVFSVLPPLWKVVSAGTVVLFLLGVAIFLFLAEFVLASFVVAGVAVASAAGAYEGIVRFLSEATGQTDSPEKDSPR